MTRYVYDAILEAVVPAAGRNYFDRHEKRSDLACPAMHPGGMPEIKSMADGRRYDTKRNYTKSVHRAGCEIIGFDKDPDRHTPSPMPSDKALEQDIARDVQKAWEVEQSKVPSYGPESRRLMRKQRRAERASKA